MEAVVTAEKFRIPDIILLQTFLIDIAHRKSATVSFLHPKGELRARASRSLSDFFEFNRVPKANFSQEE
jgi:hypothetical protein